MESGNSKIEKSLILIEKQNKQPENRTIPPYKYSENLRYLLEVATMSTFKN